MTEKNTSSGFKPSLDCVMVFVPIAIALRFVPSLENPTALFIVSCLAIIPLAGWMGVDVELDRGSVECELIAGGVARRLGGADARRAQPRQIEWQLAQRVIVRDVLGVAAGERGVGKRARGAYGAKRCRRVGAAERHARTAGQRGSNRVGASHGLLD